jgi:hypothetical protein
MSESSNPLEFEALLPRLDTPVRIGCFQDALVFVRRWTIREKDLEVRDLLRRMQRASNWHDTLSLVGELRQKLATRGRLQQASVH